MAQKLAEEEKEEEIDNADLTDACWKEEEIQIHSKASC